MGTNTLTVNSFFTTPKVSFGTKPENYFEKFINKSKADFAKMQAEIKREKEAEAKRKAEEEAKRIFERNVNTVASVIKNERRTPKNVNPKELACSIVKTAQIAGVDTLLLACICQQESGFNQNKLGNSGKGIAQITSIVPRDMYQSHRAKLYDENLAKLIEEYKSLDKVFAAKKANPKLNLGDFGEMLYKYKNSDTLFSALQKDRDLNLKCAAYAIRFHLKTKKGNVEKALASYNTVYETYASEVMERISNAKKYMSKLDVKY